MQVFIEREIKKVKKVKQNKRYWFIRTYAGEAFDYYMHGDFVGLGLNNVPLKYITESVPENLPAFNTLQYFIAENTDYKKGEATRWANQLVAFANEISVGDCVIIPSRSSDQLAFGTITSDIYLVKDPGKIFHRDKEEPLPEKRRSVKWNEVINRDDLQGELRSLLSSHQGITNADEFGYIIEGAQEPIFIKGEHIYLVLQVGKNEDINAFELERFLSSLTYFYKEFCIDNGFPDNEDLTIKIRLQSEGRAYLKASIWAGIVGLSAIVLMCNHPKVKFEAMGVKFEAEAAGVWSSYTEFLDKKQEREIRLIIFKDSMDKLNAKENVNTNLLEEEPFYKSKKRGKKK